MCKHNFEIYKFPFWEMIDSSKITIALHVNGHEVAIWNRVLLLLVNKTQGLLQVWMQEESDRISNDKGETDSVLQKNASRTIVIIILSLE